MRPVRYLGILLLLIGANPKSKAQTDFQYSLRYLDSTATTQFNDAVIWPNGSTATLARSLQDSISPTVSRVVKLDIIGTPIWSKEITYPVPMGSQRLVTYPDGGLGVFSVEIEFPRSSTYRIHRLDSMGNSIWSYTYEVDDLLDRDYGYSSARGRNDGSTFMSLGLLWSPTLILLDPSGTPQWAKSYYTIDPDEPEPKSPSFDFCITQDGGAILTEKAIFEMMLTKVDSMGEIDWSKRYSNGDYTHPKATIQLSDGSFLVAGYRNELDHVPFAAHVTSQGNIEWFKTYEDLALHDGFQRIHELADGDIFLSGRESITTSTSQDLGILIGENGSVKKRVQASNDLPNVDLAVIGGKDDKLFIAGQLWTPYENGGQAHLQAWLVDSSIANVCGVFLEDPLTVEVDEFLSPQNLLTSYNSLAREIITEPVVEVQVDRSVQVEQFCIWMGDGTTSRPDPELIISPTILGSGELFRLTGIDQAQAVKVFNMTGTLLFQATPLGTDALSISTTGWSSGVYLVVVHDQDSYSTRHARIVLF